VPPTENKRQTILDNALALFAKCGFDGFSASTLAQASGVSKATVFHHFKSLDDIMLEAFEQFVMGMEIFAPPKHNTLRDWLIEVGEASFGMEEFEESLARAYLVFTTKALFDDRLARRLEETVGAGCMTFSDIIKGLNDGPTTAKDREALTDLILMTLDAMIIHFTVFPDRRDNVHRAWAAFVDQVAPLVEEKAA
jgi:AcrR family transcriptional regulator